MYYVLKMQQISLLSKYLIWISKGIFLRTFMYVNPRLYKVNYCDIMEKDLTCCHKIIFLKPKIITF